MIWLMIGWVVIYLVMLRISTALVTGRLSLDPLWMFILPCLAMIASSLGLLLSGSYLVVVYVYPPSFIQLLYIGSYIFRNN